MPWFNLSLKMDREGVLIPLSHGKKFFIATPSVGQQYYLVMHVINLCFSWWYLVALGLVVWLVWQEVKQADQEEGESQD